MRCPRCSSPLAPADDVGAGVLACSCGVFFVTSDARVKLFAWLRVAEETWSAVLAQGKRGPTCACGAPMQTASLKGVTVDGCGSCGGLLLDPGELRGLTGLHEPAAPQQPEPVASAAGAAPLSSSQALGRVFLPSREALDVFVGASRSFHLLQVKSQVGGELLGMPVNQPFQWTVSNGTMTGTIRPDDDSTARQLLAFVTGNVVSSRFLLRDGRDNPLLVFVRKTKLLNAVVDVLHADDERPLGRITRSVVGMALDIADARGEPALRFEKRLGDIWGFSVVDPHDRKIGDVTRGFANVEVDMTLLGGLDVERSVRRDDFELAFADDASLPRRALGVAATFLVAHTSSGPGGLTALFD